jgi:hypothetical protein
MSCWNAPYILVPSDTKDIISTALAVVESVGAVLPGHLYALPKASVIEPAVD